MKVISVVVMLLAGAWAQAATVDPASVYVKDILARGQQILEVKEEADRNVQMCELLRQNLGSDSIAKVWLGQFYSLEREQGAVAQFTYMVPSILMTKATPVLGAGGSNGTVEVDAEATVRADHILQVGVTVTANGRVHRGFAIVAEESSAVFKLIDVEYNGFSAVGYQAREYQQFLNRQYNKDPDNSMPVTALVQHVASQGDYLECP